MTAHELLSTQIDKAGFMLGKALAGISEAHADFKIAPMMSPREQVVHLTDCYFAAQKFLLGESYEFGSYSAGDGTLAEAIAAMFNARLGAITIFQGLETDDALNHAGDFLVSHDHYHIGQLVILHFAIDNEWDHYSIYGE